MSLVLSRQIDSIDERTKDIVHGYIKNIQSLIPNNFNLYFNIPSAVCTIITVYYFNSDHFTLHGRCITLNKSKNSLQYITYNDTNVPNANTVYGKLAITKYDVGRHIWIIKII